MALPDDIRKLLKSEGYKTNEVILDAINDFINTVVEENEEMEEEDDDSGSDDEVDSPEGLKADR